ncbi:MAG: flippase-like domain-containing protein [Xanthomonadaceae bacterium]|nr:flippase-like domain-containing protein [Xanthomonadaceae bacterium]
MKARLFAIVIGLLGLGLAVWLVFHEGVRDILAVLEVSGWSILWLIPLHFAPVAVDARGWQALLRPFDPGRRATFPFLSWIAAVREAVDRLLPVANVGGQVVGIRLVLLRPLSGAAAAASVLVDILLNIVTQCLFTTIGLVLLIVLVHDTRAANGLIAALVATLPLPVVLYFMLRNGRIFDRVKHGVVRLLGGNHRLPAAIANSATELDHALGVLLRMPKPLAAALGWQLVGMALGGAETWVALWLLGSPVSIWEALALESLTSAVRAFVFFVPAGVGVQEAGFVVFGNLIGLPADVSVALSLVKRLRDIGFGIPALLSWQWAEGRNLRARLRAPRHRLE